MSREGVRSTGIISRLDWSEQERKASWKRELGEQTTFLEAQRCARGTRHSGGEGPGRKRAFRGQRGWECALEGAGVRGYLPGLAMPQTPPPDNVALATGLLGCVTGPVFGFMLCCQTKDLHFHFALGPQIPQQSCPPARKVHFPPCFLSGQAPMGRETGGGPEGAWVPTPQVLPAPRGCEGGDGPSLTPGPEPGSWRA